MTRYTTKVRAQVNGKWESVALSALLPSEREVRIAQWERENRYPVRMKEPGY